MFKKLNPEVRIKRQEEYVGKKFGRLTINSIFIGNDNLLHASCTCECGNHVEPPLQCVKSGNTKSCGCLGKEKIEALRKTHGESKERLYKIWITMRKRCNNKNDKFYKDYGGRGIKVCEEWNNDYLVFKEWALNNGYIEGSTYQECSIDRINHDGDYEPSNCRWVDMITQANNKRNNRIIEYNGESHTMAEWGRITGVDPDTIFARLQYGFTGADLFKKGRLKRRFFKKED